MSTIGVETERLALEWASAAEAVRFVSLVTTFINKMARLGPLHPDEKQAVKMKAARLALESASVRMALAKCVRTARREKPLPAILTDDEVAAGVAKAISTQSATQELVLHLREKPLTAEECAKRLDRSIDEVVEIFGRVTKKKLVEPDRLIG